MRGHAFVSGRRCYLSLPDGARAGGDVPVRPPYKSSIRSSTTWIGRRLKANGFVAAPRFANSWLMFEALADPSAWTSCFNLSSGSRGLHAAPLGKVVDERSIDSARRRQLRRTTGELGRLRPKDTFDVKGMIPRYDDRRVSAHQGWFEDTLPSFVLPRTTAS